MVNKTTQSNSLLRTSYTPGQIEFVRWIFAHRSALTVFDECTVSRDELIALLHSSSSYIAVPAWIAADRNRRAGRGNYLIPEMNQTQSWLDNPALLNNNTRGRKAGSKNVKGRPQVTLASVVPPVPTKTQPITPQIANCSGAGIGIGDYIPSTHETVSVPTHGTLSRPGNTTQGIAL